jgi:hypothetical protein
VYSSGVLIFRDLLTIITLALLRYVQIDTHAFFSLEFLAPALLSEHVDKQQRHGTAQNHMLA